jgi:hypothetical protein
VIPQNIKMIANLAFSKQSNSSISIELGNSHFVIKADLIHSWITKKLNQNLIATAMFSFIAALIFLGDIIWVADETH